MEQKRTAPERWRRMPDRVRPEDRQATTPASPPPASQVISGDVPPQEPGG